MALLCKTEITQVIHINISITMHTHAIATILPGTPCQKAPAPMGKISKSNIHSSDLASTSFDLIERTLLIQTVVVAITQFVQLVRPS